MSYMVNYVILLGSSIVESNEFHYSESKNVPLIWNCHSAFQDYALGTGENRISYQCATSIYADFISGYIKNLLDRFLFMPYTMPFIGKYCIIILSMYRSDIDETMRYLYRYFSLLGFNVIGILSYRDSKHHFTR